jgi:hypothetical protein
MTAVTHQRLAALTAPLLFAAHRFAVFAATMLVVG